ncbi:SMP-30/gluconolactonase/LRE family protein [Salsuginibacillus kocurii]|uniref:SMP-30/gluconolactonase/LRE family protein n=1 Tax=Salsuginibacillus kocurii TaxID=427078 RepID=UPI0003800B93|nr:SMP-30/gluconolactonase/LRE family protein [Salsuginibacillus kocurii]
MQAELVLDAKAKLGEGPAWDGRVGVLYWVDIEGCAVHTYEPASGAWETYEFEEHVSAAIPMSAGGLILATENGISTFDMETKEQTVRVPLMSNKPSIRFNDAKCDPSGRLWAGTMAFGSTPGRADLFRLEESFEYTHVLSDLTVSNGMAWDTERELMYFIDTPTQAVYVFDYDKTSGAISNQRVALDVSAENGKPDGMTMDTEGMLWIAFFRGGKVISWDPIKQKKGREINLPVSKVTSCTFGGPEMTDLYITTASTGLSEAELRDEPLAGGLFHVELDVPGVPSYRFGK